MARMELGDNVLRCPSCGGENLHHGSVSVFSRLKEDAEVRLAHVNTAGGVTVQTVASATSPSPRRDGLAIRFRCEHCPDAVFILEIYQHKGSTYTRWRGAPDV
jgi:hypothetical protein